jgi:ubiquinone/menaquinone biosynthesis C-methylase UbiE
VRWVNEEHAKLCSSDEWIEFLRTEVVAPFAAVDFGKTVLELGPGPGAATGWLVERAGDLTCLEPDSEAAGLLAERFADRSVEVVNGDAARMKFADASFDTVCCFTMLHHVPTRREQNAILSESLRVLRAGGAFLGADSLASVDLHHFHVDDVYNPVEPSAFLIQLQTVGFRRITLTVDDDLLRFIAYKPDANSEDERSCSEDRVRST